MQQRQSEATWHRPYFRISRRFCELHIHIHIYICIILIYHFMCNHYYYCGVHWSVLKSSKWCGIDCQIKDNQSDYNILQEWSACAARMCMPSPQSRSATSFCCCFLCILVDQLRAHTQAASARRQIVRISLLVYAWHCVASHRFHTYTCEYTYIWAYPPSVSFRSTVRMTAIDVAARSPKA